MGRIVRVLSLLRDDRRVECLVSARVARVDVLCWLAVGALGSVSFYTYNRQKMFVGGGGVTGSCAWIDWSCGGAITPCEARYCSSFWMVFRLRVTPAGS